MSYDPDSYRESYEFFRIEKTSLSPSLRGVAKNEAKQSFLIHSNVSRWICEQAEDVA